MMTLEELRSERAMRAAELQQLDAKIEEHRRLLPEVAVADALHDLLCRLNHADMCGYHYEKWDDAFLDDGKRAWTKCKYLEIARKCLKSWDADVILGVIQTIQDP